MSTLSIPSNAAPRINPGFAPRLVASARAQVSNRRLSAPVIAILGLVMIQLVMLVVGALISQGAYQLAQLKQTKKELTTTSDILSAQVDSLSSQQNLANAAHGLGMVANTNPVFLVLADQTVIGKPTAAYATSAHVAQNLVPNAMLTDQTDVAAIRAAALAAKAARAAAASATAKVSAQTTVPTVKINVVKPVSPVSQVASTGGLLASPTH